MTRGARARREYNRVGSGATGNGAGVAPPLWRGIHPVYSVGAIVLLIAFGRILLMQTPAWLRVGRGIMAAFGAG